MNEENVCRGDATVCGAEGCSMTHRILTQGKETQGRVRSRNRQLSHLIAAVLLVCAIACSGGGGSDDDDGDGDLPNGIGASFISSGTPSSPDGVRLTGTTSGDIVIIKVVIAGPTTSTDLYSFAFDLLFSDPTVVESIGASVDFGAALILTGGQTGEALATLNGDRVTVGVSKVGGGAGNGLGATEETVVSMTLRVRRRAITTVQIAGSPPNDPAALDSAGAIIGSVVFDPGSATISGN